MDSRDLQILRHIIKYCEEVSTFVGMLNQDYNVFVGDKLSYRALSMDIFQIGELSCHLSEEFKDKTKDKMQWGLMRGLRNILAHDYGNADPSVLWEIAIKDIPVLHKFCLQEVKRRSRNNPQR